MSLLNELQWNEKTGIISGLISDEERKKFKTIKTTEDKEDKNRLKYLKSKKRQIMSLVDFETKEEKKEYWQNYCSYGAYGIDRLIRDLATLLFDCTNWEAMLKNAEGEILQGQKIKWCIGNGEESKYNWIRDNFPELLDDVMQAFEKGEHDT